MRSRVLATKTFARWARRERRVWGASLREAVGEIEGGLVDARLGGGLYKKRVARAGGGKSGGMRTLVAGNFRDRWVFLYGFAKNDRENLDEQELRALKRIAEALLQMETSSLDEAIESGKLLEVPNGQPPASQGTH